MLPAIRMTTAPDSPRGGGSPFRAPRFSVVALAVCVAVGVLRIVLTYLTLYQTIDEPIHVAAGLHWLTADQTRFDSDGTFFQENYAPLGSLAAAVLPFLRGLRPGRDVPDIAREGHAILRTGNDFELNLALARAGTLPFFAGATVLVWLWARHIGRQSLPRNRFPRQTNRPRANSPSFSASSARPGAGTSFPS